jgi:siroheme synthase (precorrin-2 oxidase/ferrochelatase)
LVVVGGGELGLARSLEFLYSGYKIHVYFPTIIFRKSREEPWSTK